MLQKLPSIRLNSGVGFQQIASTSKLPKIPQCCGILGKHTLTTLIWEMKDLKDEKQKSEAEAEEI